MGLLFLHSFSELLNVGSLTHIQGEICSLYHFRACADLPRVLADPVRDVFLLGLLQVIERDDKLSEPRNFPYSRSKCLLHHSSYIFIDLCILLGKNSYLVQTCYCGGGFGLTAIGYFLSKESSPPQNRLI